MSGEKLCFLVSWFDKNAGAKRQFHLYYYSNEKSFEMFDLKAKKTFLRKSASDQLSLGDLYIGNTVVLYSRSLTILDYGDDFTRNNCSNKMENSFGLIKPAGIASAGELFEKVQNSGLTLARIKMVNLSRRQAEMIYNRLQTKPNFNDMVMEVCDKPCIVFEFVGEDTRKKWNCINDDISSEDDVVYSPQDFEDSINLLSYFFPNSRSLLEQPSIGPNYSTQLNTTCCVIRPHAYDKLGKIVQDILDAGFTIKAMETFLLDFSKAEEFMEVYKGVLECYGDLLKEMSSGVCLALQIVGELDNNDCDIVSRFRQFCGPMDPAIARSLRPGTLRAKYGESVIKNAIHCTDLIDDGPLEIEYFFKILQ